MHNTFYVIKNTIVMKITTIEDVHEAFCQKNMKVFGVGGTPITRTEAHRMLRDFEVICSVDALAEISAIEKKMQITCFPLKKSNGIYIKKPSKILAQEQVCAHINAAKKDYEHIGIFVMKPDAAVEKICHDNGWILIGNSADIIAKYNDKVVFQEILQATGLAGDAIVMPLRDVHERRDAIFAQLGDKIVIQLPEVSGGGHGTFFFDKKNAQTMIEEIEKRIAKIDEEINASTTYVIINRYVSGPALSILGTITRDNGVIVAQPQHQLIDIADVTQTKDDASGIFCGHEWTLPIPQNIREHAIDCVKKIGTHLQKNGVIGIFGTDLMWDVERDCVVPIEINTRLTGVFPSFVDVQILHDEVPLLAFHMMDFLRIPYQVTDYHLYRKEGFHIGAHLIIFNNAPGTIHITRSELRSGVYTMIDDKLEFVREGFEMMDLCHDQEFVITDGVPAVGDVYAKNRKLLKVISRTSLGEDSYTLTAWGSAIVAGVYNAITYTLSE